MITEDFYRDYQSRLLVGDRTGCTARVNSLLESGIQIRDLYIHLFQRSLYEVGQLWEFNKISVATEHLCTSITESLISLTYPYMFSAPHTGKSAVITCTPGEYHQIGARMVADYFEMSGWDGYFLGANTPLTELIRFIGEKKPDVVAISMSVAFSLSSLSGLIREVRRQYPGLAIILGGQGLKWTDHVIFEGVPNVHVVMTLDELEQNFMKPSARVA